MKMMMMMDHDHDQPRSVGRRLSTTVVSRQPQRQLRRIPISCNNTTTTIATMIRTKIFMVFVLYSCSMTLLQQQQQHSVVMASTTMTGATGDTTTNQLNNNHHQNLPDLFDQFDSNHDHMIDRMEYTNGMTNVVSQLQLVTALSSTHKSFTTWLLQDIFSYDTTTTTTTAQSNNANPTDPSAITTTITTTNQVISIWNGFWKAFTSSIMMILATEIGDKTFFIAAILSMKHSRTIIFSGSILALIVMTIISTGMGLILPKLLDRKYTHLLSGLLFLYFGCKLVYDSRSMEHGKVSEELEEVEEELLQQQQQQQTKSQQHAKKNKKKGDDDDIEGGNNHTNNSNINHHPPPHHLSTYAILMMAFTLTFVAEWGDRSQIATIALASAKNPIGVTIGSIIGHSICTASACVGGRMLASNISEKTVSQYGGIIFLLFGFHSLFLEQ